MLTSKKKALFLASPIVVNLLLPFLTMELDAYLEAHTLYSLAALLLLAVYPIFAGFVLREAAAIIGYLVLHVLTALMAVFLIYNDSALVYAYFSLILFLVGLVCSRLLFYFLGRRKS